MFPAIKSMLRTPDTGPESRGVGRGDCSAGACPQLRTDRSFAQVARPGVHVAFGNPYPDETGATWRASVHVDTIPTDCDIDVDGRPLMRAGRFLFDT